MTGRKDGWIDQLGTLTQWRGRGLVSQLIVASLNAFAVDGLDARAIGVDSENPTVPRACTAGSASRPQQRSIDYEIALDAELPSPDLSRRHVEVRRRQRAPPRGAGHPARSATR